MIRGEFESIALKPLELTSAKFWQVFGALYGEQMIRDIHKLRELLVHTGHSLPSSPRWLAKIVVEVIIHTKLEDDGAHGAFKDSIDSVLEGGGRH